jgi:4-amino-4-deoxy-L-arabinose transferase-like glycosyltransferase
MGTGPGFLRLSIGVYDSPQVKSRQRRGTEEAASRSTPTSIPWRALATLVALGVGLRLLVASALWANGGNPLIGDEGNYVYSALPLAEGRAIPDLWLWIRAPGFIFFAAGIFALTGGSLLALNLAQIALAAFSQLVAFGLGRLTTSDPVVGQRAGLWAAALIGLNPLLIFNDNFFLSEPLFLLLLLLLVFTLSIYAERVRKGEGRAWPWLLLAGATTGLGLLTRPNLQVYLPFVVLWLAWLHRRSLSQAIVRPLAFAALAIVVVLPWSFYNLERHGNFIFVDTVGSYVLFLDNTDLSATEVVDTLDDIQGHGARQEYAVGRAIEWINANKAEFAGRTLYRMATSWVADPFSDLRLPIRDKLPGTAPWVRDFYALAASFAYIVLTVLAIGGLFSSPRSPVKALTLLFLLSYVIMLGLSNDEFRYRLPVLGLTAVMAGYALAAPHVFWPLREGGRWKSATLAAVLISMVFVITTLPRVAPGLSRSVVARLAEMESRNYGDPAERAAAMERVAALDRVYSAPFREAGVLWLEAGQPEQALDRFLDALQVEPRDWRARALLSFTYRDLGQHQHAAKVARGAPSTYDAVMQDWACEHGPPLPTRVEVGNGDLGWVRGFHGGETSADHPGLDYRWSTSHAAVDVARAPGSNSVVVRARALPMPDGGPLKVRWRINRHDVAEFAMDGEWREYTLQIPPDTKAGDDLVVELFAPARRPSVEDMRELAVAVDWVSTLPSR